MAYLGFAELLELFGWIVASRHNEQRRDLTAHLFFADCFETMRCAAHATDPQVLHNKLEDRSLQPIRPEDHENQYPLEAGQAIT